MSLNLLLKFGNHISSGAGAERETGSADLRAEKKNTLGFVKMIIMLHKQPIKAKNNNSVAVFFIYLQEMTR